MAAGSSLFQCCATASANGSSGLGALSRAWMLQVKEAWAGLWLQPWKRTTTRKASNSGWCALNECVESRIGTFSVQTLQSGWRSRPMASSSVKRVEEKASSGSGSGAYSWACTTRHAGAFGKREEKMDGWPGETNDPRGGREDSTGLPTGCYATCVDRSIDDGTAHLNRTVRICKAGLHLSFSISRHMRPSLSTLGW